MKPNTLTYDQMQQVNEPETTAVQVVNAEPTPMAMIAEAVRLDLDPAKLHALMDLQQRVEAQAAEAAFTAAMSKCQSEMPTVVRDKTNSHTRSKYASLEAVQQTIKPTYLKHGFAISISEAESTKPDMIRVRLVLRHVGGHSETYYREGANDSKGAKGGAVKTDLQGAQSTVSYLARQMLLSIFGVTVADQDNDGNEVEGDFITEDQKQEIYRLVDLTKTAPETVLKFAKVEELALIRQGPNHKKVYYMLLDRAKDMGVKL
jgi:hypothetical protein